MGINLASISGKKKIQEYQESILRQLRKFPSAISSFQLAVPQFIAMAESDPIDTLKRVFEFFPSHFGGQEISNPQNIFESLPKFPSGDPKLTYLISYFSEAVFALLTDRILEKLQDPLDKEMFNMLADRVIFKGCKATETKGFCLSIMLLSIDRFRNIIRFLNRTDCERLEGYVVEHLPVRRQNPTHLTLFLKALSYIKFKDVSSWVDRLDRLFDAFPKNVDILGQVMNCFLCWFPLLPLEDSDVIKRAEKRVEGLVKEGDLRNYAVPLLGMIQSSALATHRHDKFIERYVYQKLKKNKHVKYSFAYMINVFAVAGAMRNWRQELVPFAQQFYQNLLGMSPQSGQLDKSAGIFLKSLAVFDFHMFVMTILPEMLKSSDPLISVAFQTCELIINPVFGFLEEIKRSPRAATFDYLMNVLNRTITTFIMNSSGNTSEEDLAFAYLPFQDVLKTITVPLSDDFANGTNIPSKIVYFLANLQQFMDFRPLPLETRDKMKKNEEKCRESLAAWQVFFDLPHKTFGDINERVNLKLETQRGPRRSWKIYASKLMPFLVTGEKVLIEFTKVLLDMVIDGEVMTSFAASLVLESLFVAFEENANLLLDCVNHSIRYRSSLSPNALHRAIQLYDHCFRLWVQTGPLDQNRLLAIDLVGCLGLCSPFPETRIISFSLLEFAEPFRVNTGCKAGLYHLLKERAEDLEQKVANVVLSEYTSSFLTRSGLHRIPSISTEQARSSPFVLLWTFFLAAIFEEATELSVPQMTETHTFMIETLCQKLNNSTDMNPVDLNKLLFVMVSAPTISNVGSQAVNKWVEQMDKMYEILETLIRLKCASPGFAFVLACVHTGGLQRVIHSFVNLLEDEQEEKISALEILAGILRHVAMQNRVDDHMTKMIDSGEMQRIFCIYDFKLLTMSQDPRMTQILANFLIFRAMYFRFLYRQRRVPLNGPLERHPLCGPIEDEEICPYRVGMARLFFDHLFALSQKDGVLADAARVTISYLAALRPFISNGNEIGTEFLKECTKIAVVRPEFLTRLIANHFHLMFHKVIENILEFPLNEAQVYLVSLSQQFVYSLDTRVDSYGGFMSKKSDETGLGPDNYNFVRVVFEETGGLILSGLLFLMHDDMHIRSAAMTMMARVLPILCLMDPNSTKEHARELLKAIRTAVLSLSTQNEVVLLENAVKLSSVCARVFGNATEQVFSRAFGCLPKIWQVRKCCTREHVLMLLRPWVDNIRFDLKNHTLVKRKSRIFTCYSFMSDMCACMNQIEWNDAALEFWKGFSNRPDTPFVTLAIVDLAISNRELQGFAIRLLSYLYRLSSNTVSFVVPYIAYENWYFYHVQLDRFEEVKDMNKLLDGDKDIKIEASTDQYNESVGFALDALQALVVEDLLAVSSEEKFSVIISFCLTHLNMKPAFQLLKSYAFILRSSFDAGVPIVLSDICELLERASSLPFDSLHFSATCVDPPLRSLQDRVVSLPGLLEAFIGLTPFLGFDADDLTAQSFLLWGSACGDLEIARRSLYLYSYGFHSIDKKVTSHILRSTSITMQCWIDSNCSEVTTLAVANYLEAAIHALHVISQDMMKKSVPLEDFSVFFDLVIAIIRLKGDILPMIIRETLIFLTDLLEWHCVPTTLDGDLVPILVASVLTCHDLPIIVRFIIQLLNGPPALLSTTRDYVIYIIMFIPIFSTSIDCPTSVSEFCSLSQIRAAAQRCEQLVNAKLFSRPDTSGRSISVAILSALAPLTSVSVLDTAAALLTSLLSSSLGLFSSSIFDMASVLMSLGPTKTRCERLGRLTCEATLNQLSGINQSKILYLQTIAKYSDKVNLSLMALSPNTELLQIDKKWVEVFQQIQSSTCQVIKQPDHPVVMRFDTLESFPPIIPFEPEILRSPTVQQVSNLCRSIQVNPQSNWALSLYCATGAAEKKAQVEAEAPSLQLDEDFPCIIQELLDDIIQEETSPDSGESHESETEENTLNSIPNYQVDDTIYSLGSGDNMITSVKIEAFLPELSKLDKLFVTKSN